MFQFLIGRLQTEETMRAIKSIQSKFQFLIGRLQTLRVHIGFASLGFLFQFLIGRLQTIESQQSHDAMDARFNSL